MPARSARCPSPWRGLPSVEPRAGRQRAQLLRAACAPRPALTLEPQAGKSSGGSSGGGDGARPGLERSRGERSRAEGSGSHNGRARGAEPPAPRALAAAAEAEPAQPPNSLPHPTPSADTAPRSPKRASPSLHPTRSASALPAAAPR